MTWWTDVRAIDAGSKEIVVVMNPRECSIKWNDPEELRCELRSKVKNCR